jgi:predicted Zn-dependent protease
VSPELRDLGGLANTGLGLLFLKYGRDDERQADELGFDYMVAQGYDPREMERVFATLLASGDLAGASAVPTWLASHPSEPDRIEAARERVAAAGTLARDLTVGADAYLAEIDGLAYGEDPRAGYFENGMFYHPELAFQFRVPDDWQKQNLRSAVQAVSPGSDAALELTVGGDDVEAAARAFLSQEGLAEISSDRTRINGLDAIVSGFEAAAQNGAVQGIVAHIAIGDATYRLVTYAPPAAFAAQRDVLMDIVRSFAPVTDQDVFDVHAKRIEIVEIDRAMTLGEFAREYPSDISLEELAVINQVSGADAMLAADSEVKRVV